MTLEDIINKMIDQEHNSQQHTIPSGLTLNRFPRLTHTLDGIQKGVYLVTGDHGIGKSTFLVNLLMDVLDSNVREKCFYFSFKETADSIMTRLNSYWTGLDIATIKGGGVAEKDRCLLAICKNEITQIMLTDRLYLHAAKDMKDVENAMKADLDRKRKVVVFLDDPFTPVSGMKNNEDSSKIKMLAEEYNIPIFVARNSVNGAFPPDIHWDFGLQLKMGAFGEVDSAGQLILKKETGPGKQIEDLLLEVYLGEDKASTPNTPDASYHLRFDTQCAKITELSAILADDDQESERDQSLMKDFDEYIDNGEPLDLDAAPLEQESNRSGKLEDILGKKSPTHTGDTIDPGELAEIGESGNVVSDLNTLLTEDETNDDRQLDEERERFREFLDRKMDEHKKNHPMFSLEDSSEFDDMFPGQYMGKQTIVSEDKDSDVSSFPKQPAQSSVIGKNDVEFFELTNFEGLNKHEREFHNFIAKGLFKKRNIKDSKNSGNNTPTT